VLKPVAGSYWYGAWRSTEYRQAVALVGESYTLSGAWRHGMFRQAVAVRQWRWKGSDAWRGAGTARRSGTVSPGGVWAEPGGNVVVLAFWVCCF